MSQGSIATGSVNVTWDYEGEKSASASSDGVGAFTGDGTGTINHNTGAFSFWPTILPDPATKFRYRWIKAGSKVAAPIADLNVVQELKTVRGTIPNAPLVPGQTVMAIQLSPATSAVEVISNVSVRLTDDGSGKLVTASGTILGTLDVGTGEFAITAPTSAAFRVKKYGYKRGVEQDKYQSWVWYKTVDQTISCSLDSLTNVWYMPTSSPESFDKTFELGALTFELTPQSSEIIAQSSLRFTFGGRTYIDRLGYLYSNVDPETGSGEQSGTVDYVTGIVTITKWTPGSTNSKPVIQSLLTYVDAHTVSDIAFRTPGAPVRPGSIYVQCTAADGETHELTLPTTGVVNSGIFHGTVDHDTGVVVLQFGSFVTAADYTSAEWYDPELVDANGKILKPVQIRADSLRYNCVTYSYIPLDADLIGLDPVRLPSDGRVPIFRTGGLVVVHSTEKTVVPNNPTAGTVVDAGRTRLAHLHVEDSAGVPLPAGAYQSELDSGSVTFTSSLSLTGLVQPLWVVHRVEDMSLVRDVEISGRLSLARQLSHNYPASSTLVSSVLLAGDRQARYTNLFDQATWTNEWSDTVIGDETSAQFNEVLYPITVTNRGAITEEWALIFTSASVFRIVGRSVGQIGVGDITTPCAPNNPATGVPYWSINPLAFGAGWSAGNVLRFNTIGAEFPVQVARTILQSDASMADDKFALQIRGNVNK